MGTEFGTWTACQSIHGADSLASFEFWFTNRPIPSLPTMGNYHLWRINVHGPDGVLLARAQATLGRVLDQILQG